MNWLTDFKAEAKIYVDRGLPEIRVPVRSDRLLALLMCVEAAQAVRQSALKANPANVPVELFNNVGLLIDTFTHLDTLEGK